MGVEVQEGNGEGDGGNGGSLAESGGTGVDLRYSQCEKARVEGVRRVWGTLKVNT